VVSGQSYSEMLHCVGKSPKYPLDRKSGGAQNCFELSYKIKVLVCVGIRFRYCPHVDMSLTVPLILSSKFTNLPVPLAARSKAKFFGRWPIEIVGSNPTGAWKFSFCECCVLSGRGLCDGLITSPEGSYRLWRVVV
jgi:hypothetical protein